MDKFDNTNTDTMAAIAEQLDARNLHSMADCVSALAYQRDAMREALYAAIAALTPPRNNEEQEALDKIKNTLTEVDGEPTKEGT